MVSDVKYRNALTDVNIILNELDDNERNKVPKKFQMFITEYMNTTYDSSIDVNVPLNQQKLSNETRALLALLYLKYWYKDEEDKKTFMNTLTENEKEYQIELAKKYDVNNLFIETKYESNSENVSNPNEEVKNEGNVEIVEYKEPLFKRIVNKILGLFRRDV